LLDPVFLDAFDDLSAKEAPRNAALAPTPASGHVVRKASVTAALRRAARTRGIPAPVDAIDSALRREQPPRTMAEHASALLDALDTLAAKTA
jgi:hypothetical protein